MGSYRLLSELAVSGKTVLVRVDFNVPFDHDKKVSDYSRVSASLPTLKNLINKGVRVLLLSHLGRPKEASKEYSLEKILPYLKEHLDTPVYFAKDCVGQPVKTVLDQAPFPSVTLLENVRFHAEETKPTIEFAKALAEHADFFVNDAFGTSHRQHASNYHLAKLFGKNAAIGLLLEKELSVFENLVNNPKRPFYAVIGGAKISTKLQMIRRLIEVVDGILIGGAMAHTFLVTQQFNLGSSLIEGAYLREAEEIIQLCKQKDKKLILPRDLVFAPHLEVEELDCACMMLARSLPAHLCAYDIGRETVELFLDTIKDAATVFWNGPLGVYESSLFSRGTNEFAKGLASMGAFKVVGGGDSLACVKQLGLDHAFEHLSTGGGAALEFLEKGELEALKPLDKAVLANS